MFKSAFAKYMLCFLLVFAVSFSALFIIVLGTVATNERENSVRHAAESIKVMVDRSYAEYISDNDSATLTSFLNDEEETLRIQLSGIADCTNTILFLTNKNGTVCVSSSGSNLRGKVIPEDVTNSVITEAGYYSFTGNPGDIFEEKMLIEGIELSTGDNHGCVFACSSISELSPFVIDTLSTMIWITILVFIAGVVACYFISLRITEPLKAMSDVAMKYTAGDLSARVQVVGSYEITKLASTMNKMAESLEETETMRNTFLSSVAHELRTPMTTITGFIDGILDGAIPPEGQNHYLEIVSTEVRRLSRLVSSLLDISRIQAGDRKFDIKEFDICEKARQVLISNEKRIDDKKLDVVFECDEDNMFALGDVDSVHQIMYNIVDNAIKFSYEHGRLEILLKHAEGRRVRVDVFNEGIGMSQEDARHVFDRFYKADKSRGLDKTGVGLGMYITRTIIEAMKGSIGVESEEGKWCRFTFYLPESGRISASPDDISDELTD